MYNCACNPVCKLSIYILVYTECMTCLLHGDEILIPSSTICICRPFLLSLFCDLHGNI